MVNTSNRLEGEARAFVLAARRASMATIAPAGPPRLVPVCFELVADHLWIAIDDKPKRSADPMALARVRDVVERPAVSMLVDRWDEDWTRLGWVRIEGQAGIVAARSPGHEAAIAALRAKYPQYRSHRVEERPAIRVAIERVVTWGVLGL